jgi:hypothetical protein
MNKRTNISLFWNSLIFIQILDNNVMSLFIENQQFKFTITLKDRRENRK